MPTTKRGKKQLPMRVCACNLPDPDTGRICRTRFQPVNAQHLMIAAHKNRLKQKRHRERAKDNGKG